MPAGRFVLTTARGAPFSDGPAQVPAMAGAHWDESFRSSRRSRRCPGRESDRNPGASVPG